MTNRFSYDDMKNKVQELEKLLAIPSLSPPDNVDELFGDLCNYQVVRTLPIDELEAYSVMLANYSLFIKLKENKLKSFVGWSTANIKTLIGKELSNSKEYGYEAKSADISSNSITISELDAYRVEAQAQLDCLDGIAYRIGFISELLKTIAIEKKKANRT